MNMYTLPDIKIRVVMGIIFSPHVHLHFLQLTQMRSHDNAYDTSQQPADGSIVAVAINSLQAR